MEQLRPCLRPSGVKSSKPSRSVHFSRTIAIIADGELPVYKNLQFTASLLRQYYSNPADSDEEDSFSSDDDSSDDMMLEVEVSMDIMDHGSQTDSYESTDDDEDSLEQPAKSDAVATNDTTHQPHSGADNKTTESKDDSNNDGTPQKKQSRSTGAHAANSPRSKAVASPVSKLSHKPFGQNTVSPRRLVRTATPGVLITKDRPKTITRKSTEILFFPKFRIVSPNKQVKKANVHREPSPVKIAKAPEPAKNSKPSQSKKLDEKQTPSEVGDAVTEHIPDLPFKNYLGLNKAKSGRRMAIHRIDYLSGHWFFWTTRSENSDIVREMLTVRKTGNAMLYVQNQWKRNRIVCQCSNFGSHWLYVVQELKTKVKQAVVTSEELSGLSLSSHVEDGWIRNVGYSGGIFCAVIDETRATDAAKQRVTSTTQLEETCKTLWADQQEIEHLVFDGESWIIVSGQADRVVRSQRLQWTSSWDSVIASHDDAYKLRKIVRGMCYCKRRGWLLLLERSSVRQLFHPGGTSFPESTLKEIGVVASIK